MYSRWRLYTREKARRGRNWSLIISTVPTHVRSYVGRHAAWRRPSHYVIVVAITVVLGDDVIETSRRTSTRGEPTWTDLDDWRRRRSSPTTKNSSDRTSADEPTPVRYTSSTWLYCRRLPITTHYEIIGWTAKPDARSSNYSVHNRLVSGAESHYKSHPFHTVIRIHPNSLQCHVLVICHLILFLCRKC